MKRSLSPWLVWIGLVLVGTTLVNCNLSFDPDEFGVIELDRCEEILASDDIPIEICNSEDDDCDGEIDEGNPGGNVGCNSDLPGRCEVGTTVCVDGGLVCQQQFEPQDEECNGEDDDCDGLIDEDEDEEPLRSDCFTPADGDTRSQADVGQCKTGFRLCSGGTFNNSPCEGAVYASDESCDGVDNDCDGDADEDEEGAPLATDCFEPPDGDDRSEVGVGVCASGLRQCVDGSFDNGTCEGGVYASDEVCDGLDNDCNGDTDEDEEGQLLVEVCFEPAEDDERSQEGVGLCAAGLRQCVEGSFENGACEGAVYAADEVCDGADNDCDGVADEDENDQALTRSCFFDDQPDLQVFRDEGLCVSGTATCEAGAFGDCLGQIGPVDERCDGRDNDCDGVDDNDPVDLADTCGECGVEVCTEGGKLCQDPGVNLCGGCVVLDPLPGSDVDCQGCARHICSAQDRTVCDETFCTSSQSAYVRLVPLLNGTANDAVDVYGEFSGQLTDPLSFPIGAPTPYVEVTSLFNSSFARLRFVPEGGSSSRNISTNLSQARNTLDTMVVVGEGDDPSNWNLIRFDDTQEATPGSTRLRFIELHARVQGRVDVAINGEVVIEGLARRSASDYIDVNAQIETVTVFESGTENVIFSGVAGADGFEVPITGGDTATIIHATSLPSVSTLGDVFEAGVHKFITLSERSTTKIAAEDFLGF